MVKKLTNEEEFALSNCINNLIYDEINESTTVVAVYVTAYWEDKTVHIYVNFVDTQYRADDCIAVPCRIKGIKIDKVMKSAWRFSCSPKKTASALKNSIELLDCFFVMAYPDWYEKYISSAEKEGIIESEHTVTFEPPLNLSQTQKLR